MKINFYNGCCLSNLTVDDKSVKFDGDVKLKKRVVKKLIDQIDNPVVLVGIITYLSSVIPLDNYEREDCKQCGDYTEYWEKEV